MMIYDGKLLLKTNTMTVVFETVAEKWMEGLFRN